MLYGLRESLAMLAEEGLENVFARTLIWRRVRAAVLDGGSSSSVRRSKMVSDTVSAIMVPEA